MNEKLQKAIDAYTAYLCAKYGGMSAAIRNATDFENDVLAYFKSEDNQQPKLA